MRILLCICGLAAAIAHGAAYAQTDGQSSASLTAAARAALPGGEETPQQSQARGKAWFAQCMKDWDAGTHMAKKDWERTCRRLSLDRTKFLTKSLTQQPR